MSAIIDHAVACDKGETALIERAPQGCTLSLEPTTRRAVMGATIAGLVSAAVPVTTEAAEPDPIFDLIAEMNRLRALADAADARAKACRKSLDDDMGIGGTWIPFDADHPALKPMLWWLTALTEGRPGTFFKDVLRVRRNDIERFNGLLDGPERKAQGMARLAWFDDRIAERHRLAEESGYNAAHDESDTLTAQFIAAQEAVCHATATTVSGALAQIAVAMDIRRENNETQEDEDTALMNAHGALKRLLSAGGAT